MVTKKQLIEKISTSTIKFNADGHKVVVSQFEDGPIIKIDGEQADIDELYQFSIFNIPKSIDWPYGTTKYGFAGRHIYTDEITPDKVGQTITIRGILDETSNPEPAIDVAVYQCRRCLKTHQVKPGRLHEPSQPIICDECGNHEFEILPNECKYINKQRLKLTIEAPHRLIFMPIILYGENCYEDINKIPKHGYWQGTLSVKLGKQHNTYFLNDVEAVE